MKKLLLLLFSFFTTIGSSQSVERVDISGAVIVPAGYSSGGIHIYNKSSGKGDVADTGGAFELQVKTGDSVYFSALQFKEQLVIIDFEVMKRKRLVVEIVERVNELPEVVVRPHDLSGDIQVDAGNIETQELSLPTMSAFSINDYDWEWRADVQTAVTNAAMPRGAGMKNGANLKALLGEAIGLLLPSKKAKKRTPSPRNTIGLIKLERELRSRYDDDFFQTVLNMPPANIAEFIEFIEAKDFPDDLLNKENELELLDLLVKQSEAFSHIEQN